MARYGGRPTVESSITLDIGLLMRTGLRPLCSGSGTMQWTSTNSLQPTCQLAYEAILSEDTGVLHLTGIMWFDPFGKSVRLNDQAIRMVATIPPYGGRRWWFLCPSTGQRIIKLHLPWGARVFASRQAYGLGFAVQRESKQDQAFRRTRKARAVIDGGPNLMGTLPAKPKWMRWRTYWRHVDACQRAEQKTLGLLLASAEKILGGTMGGHETA